MPTSPEAILLGKMAHHTKQIRRECRIEESSGLFHKRNLGKVYIEKRAPSPSKQALDSKRWSENSIYLCAGEWSENLGEP